MASELYERRKRSEREHSGLARAKSVVELACVIANNFDRLREEHPSLAASLEFQFRGFLFLRADGLNDAKHGIADALRTFWGDWEATRKEIDAAIEAEADEEAA